MAQWGDPRVKEWMKEHKGEVAKIQGRYDELKKLDLARLLELATLSGADLSKVKGMLIAKVIAVESERRG